MSENHLFYTKSLLDQYQENRAERTAGTVERMEPIGRVHTEGAPEAVTLSDQKVSAPEPSRNRFSSVVWAPPSPWPWIWVGVLATVPHLGAVPNPFMYDDWVNIPLNPYIVHSQGIHKLFRGHVLDYLGGAGAVSTGNYYRPMLHLVNYLVYHLLGTQPGWFHLSSVVLHLLASLLVVAVVRRVSGRRSVGVLAGLLFAVHPVHTEVIAWISSASQDLPCAVFSLLTLLLYLRVSDVPRPTGARRGLLAPALAMAASLLLALLSKEIGIIVPALVVGYEFLVLRHSVRWQWKERRPEYLALGGAIVVYLGMRTLALGGLMPVRPKISATWMEQVCTSVALFYRYLAVLVWPVDLNFFRYYDTSRSPREPVVLAGLLCLAAFVGFGLWLHRRQRPEVLALPIFLLPLLPTFLLPYLYIGLLMNERAAYLPSVAFCWLAAAGLIKLSDRFGPRALAPLLMVLLAAYTARSAVRVADWGDEVELFQEGLAHAPSAPHLHVWRADVLLRHNRAVEAVASLREAIRLRQDYASAHNLLGRAYWMLQQPQPALDHYRLAAGLALKEADPGSASRAWNNIGIVYRSVGQNQEAMAAYRQALRLDSQFAGARNNLGFVLLLEGHVEEAVRELRTAIGQEPTLGQAYANLGLAHAMQGEWEPALAALSEAERLSPDNPEVHARLGEVHLARGEAGPARRRFLRALAIQPQNPRAQAGMAALRERGGLP